MWKFRIFNNFILKKIDNKIEVMKKGFHTSKCYTVIQNVQHIIFYGRTHSGVLLLIQLISGPKSMTCG